MLMTIITRPTLIQWYTLSINPNNLFLLLFQIFKSTFKESQNNGTTNSLYDQTAAQGKFCWLHAAGRIKCEGLPVRNILEAYFLLCQFVWEKLSGLLASPTPMCVFMASWNTDLISHAHFLRKEVGISNELVPGEHMTNTRKINVCEQCDVLQGLPMCGTRQTGNKLGGKLSIFMVIYWFDFLWVKTYN